MDPIIIGVVVLLLVVLAIRMFFGVAKMLLKLVIFVVIAVFIWRMFFVP